jgi:hypothetical protein
MFYTLTTKDGEYYNNQSRDYNFTELVKLIDMRVNESRNWFVGRWDKRLNAYGFINLVRSGMEESEIYSKFS